MKKTLFIKNAAVLTVSGLLLRFAGIIFKVWMASAVGAEGMGLYQIVFSVYVLFATFATSGISTAVTRLIADELALGSQSGIGKILRRAFQFTLIAAAVSLILLFFGADFISNRILGDVRAALSIKILSFSLPFMGLCSVLKGYFFARRKATPNALSQIFEQIIRIFTVIFAVSAVRNKGIAVLCAAVFFGDAVAEGMGLLLVYIVYLFDRRALKSLSGRPRPPYGVSKEIARIALPITAGRYLNSLLRTAENILVPKNLAKYAFSGSNALSTFGMIKGMALPILFFPSTLLNAVSTLLIPEMSEALARGRRGVVASAVSKVIKITCLFGFLAGAIFFVSGEEIGLLIYKEPQVGFLLKWLSPIVPLMYLDSICDGILKGLDRQKFTFHTALCDSSLRIILVLLVLPFFGINGFIGIMYFSNIFTCFLHVGKLIKITELKINKFKFFVFPLLTGLIVAFSFDTLLNLWVGLPDLVYIILMVLLSAVTYLFILIKCDIASLDEIKNLAK